MMNIEKDIGDLSFDLLFGEEPEQKTFSSTIEEKAIKIEKIDKKIEKIDKKTLFFNRFKEKDSNKNQSSR